MVLRFDGFNTFDLPCSWCDAGAEPSSDGVFDGRRCRECVRLRGLARATPIAATEERVKPEPAFSWHPSDEWLELDPGCWERIVMFFLRADISHMNVKQFETLAKVGAFTSLSPVVPRQTFTYNAALYLNWAQGKEKPPQCRCDGCRACHGKAHFPRNHKSRKTEYFVETAKSRAGKGNPARRVGFVCHFCRYALGEIGDPTIEDGKYCEVMGHRLGPPSGLQKAKSGRRTPWPPPVQNTGQTPSNSASRASGSPRATASAPTQSLPLQSFFTSGRKSA